MEVRLGLDEREQVPQRLGYDTSAITKFAHNSKTYDFPGPNTYQYLNQSHLIQTTDLLHERDTHFGLLHEFILGRLDVEPGLLLLRRRRPFEPTNPSA